MHHTRCRNCTFGKPNHTNSLNIFTQLFCNYRERTSECRLKWWGLSQLSLLSAGRVSESHCHVEHSGHGLHYVTRAWCRRWIDLLRTFRLCDRNESRQAKINSRRMRSLKEKRLRSRHVPLRIPIRQCLRLHTLDTAQCLRYTSHTHDVSGNGWLFYREDSLPLK
jgi:hypothetical protein